MAKKTKHSTSKKHAAKHAKVSAPEKRQKHKYHHHIRYGVLIIAILTVLLIIATVISYPRLSANAAKDVVAKVNGQAITQAELDAQYDKIPEQYKMLVSKEVMLDQMINENLLLQEADKQGITVTSDEVDEIISTTLMQLGMTSADLDEKLAEQGMTQADLKDLYMKQLKITKLMEKSVLTEIEVSDEELKEMYDSMIHARHILVDTEDEAKEIISLLNSGEDFAKLASERSIEPGVTDGDLGEFGKGQMVQEFEDAAYALDIGDISQEPVQTQFGYHVIERLPREQTFAESKEELKLAVQKQKQTDAITAYIQELRDGADIEILLKE